MPWFRLDDSFHSHPKVIAAGNEAIGLFVRCGTYAAEHLTDGFIPEHVAVLYGGSQVRSRGDAADGKAEALAETLVRTKLWRRTRGGWRMPDYLDYNPSKEAVDKERKNAADRQRRSREAKLSRRDSRRDNGVSHTAPTRPDPYTADVATDRASPSTARAPTPKPISSVNGARQPPPLADVLATQAALATQDDDPPLRGRHARKGDP